MTLPHLIPNELAIVASVPVFSVLNSSVGQFSFVQNPQNPDPPTCFMVLGSVFVEHHIFPFGSRVHYICSKRLHGMFVEWWNTTKILSMICFSCLLDIGKKLKWLFELPAR